MSTEILSIEALTKTFRKDGQGLPILKNVSLSVQPGEFVAITGPSGSGKSTLLQLLGGLDRPTSGKVSLLGCSTSKLNDKQLAALRNRDVGFVFQFHFLLTELTALENVMTPLLIAGANKKEARNRALEMLEQVELNHRRDHRPAELSGGEQQRVAIARALIHRPALLLGDELTGNLDTVNGEAIYQLLRHYNRTLGQTIVVVTHNLQLAQHADRVIEMVDGQITLDAPHV